MPAPLRLGNAARELWTVRNRIRVAAVFMVLAALMVTGRLVQLQLVNHEHYRTLSQENRVKIVPLPPSRGLIYSSDGELLAENRATFTLQLRPDQVADIPATLTRLQALLGLTDGELEGFQSQLETRRRFESLSLKEDLNEEQVARFSLERHRFPGVDIVPAFRRHYPYGELLAHVLGYVGRIDEDDLDYLNAADYRGSEYTGKAGVEKTYESTLHGQVGYQQVEVNAAGRVLRVLSTTPPVPGKDLYLTLDVSLQRVARDALEGQRGAVVALDPDTGGILALVSNPGYDSNLFVGGIDATRYRALRDSPDRPLFNRALQGQYPPGSTIKPILALAGLHHGLRGAEDRSWCPGWFSLPGTSHRYRCWKRGGHGHVDLESAVAESCDVYFYELARDMGIDRLSAFMQRFGFGGRTGIDLPAESPALLPSRQWKARARNQPWYPGETVIAGIGQGFMLATPLQLAVSTATLARQGQRIQPHVVGQLEDPVHHDATEIPVHPVLDVGVHEPAHWREVLGSMHAVVQGRRGTARASAADAAYDYAGKTGTAQVFGIAQDQKASELDIPEHLQDHALFVAFAPLDRPQLAVAVVVENGGSGSSAAAPVARRLFDHHLLGPQPRLPLPPGGLPLGEGTADAPATAATTPPHG